MNLAPVFKQQFLDNNGAVLAGGKLYSYLAGTTTLQATYANATGTANANPVVLDSAGRADVWLDPTLAYKIVLQDANGVQIYSEDNVTAGSAAGIGIWNTNSTYQQGQIVADSSGQGLLYVSLINNNTGNPLTNVSAWRVQGGNTRLVTANTTLLVTDDTLRSNSGTGALTHTLPPCASTPVGKKFTIVDKGAGVFTTTLQGSGSDQIDGNVIYAAQLLANDSVTVENNGTSWDVIARSKDTPSSATISSSSGTYSAAPTSWTAVTNLSVTLTTTGRPVQLMLVCDGSGNGAQVGATSTAVTVNMQVAIYRDSTQIAFFNISSGISGASGTPNAEVMVPPGSVSHLDIPLAGSHTYTIKTQAAAATQYMQYVKLVAYEL